MTKALKYLICALAFVVVLASCTKDTELIEQAREEIKTKALHVSPELESEEAIGIPASATDTRSGEDDAPIDDGSGITDDEDDEDDDDGSSVKASTK